MKIAETFQCKIVDEYGGVYPNAIVAILDGHEYMNRSFTAEDAGSTYKFTTTTDGVSYMVMYWYEKDNVGKFKSRPLRIADGDGFTNVIGVDMDHPIAAEILAGNLQPDDKLIQLVKSDLSRRFR